MRSEIIKDNTGYDLKQMFIGGEGTLGIITKLNIHCPKIDTIRKIMVFKTDKYENIVNKLPKVKSILGKNLNAVEYMDGDAYLTVVS
jgi:FAD/FMN-containing dehydrogenase